MHDAVDRGRLDGDISSLEPETGDGNDSPDGSERMQLARELHDVVASGFAIISSQATLAEYVLEERPQDARAALGEIKRTSTEALRELQTIVRNLRLEEHGACDLAPGVARIGTLASAATKAGISTHVTLSGLRRPLPADVDLAAYRIVQESLTNAEKHSEATSASVLLVFERDRLRIEVTDDGLGSAGPPSPGHGILGMRERASALGGELDAAPGPQGGFRVRATLPLRRRR